MNPTPTTAALCNINLNPARSGFDPGLADRNPIRLCGIQAQAILDAITAGKISGLCLASERDASVKDAETLSESTRRMHQTAVALEEERDRALALAKKCGEEAATLRDIALNCERAEHQRDDALARLSAAESLFREMLPYIREVIAEHADPDAWCYNDCDKDECGWCGAMKPRADRIDAFVTFTTAPADVVTQADIDALRKGAAAMADPGLVAYVEALYVKCNHCGSDYEADRTDCPVCHDTRENSTPPSPSKEPTDV